MKKRLHLTLIVLLTSTLICLSGCGGSAARHKVSSPKNTDGPPLGKPLVDVHKVPNAVPRHEPLSRIGNRPAYTVFQQRYRVLPSSKGFREKGPASWYGRKWHGRKTANGETYDMYAMTAAHKHLPLPTYLKVTNLQNGRHVVVRVNDRGPFHGKRIVDLSYAAAAKLDLVSPGIAWVEIEAINPSKNKSRNKISDHPKLKEPIPIPRRIKQSYPKKPVIITKKPPPERKTQPGKQRVAIPPQYG
jgi:rare lipoprotein A